MRWLFHRNASDKDLDDEFQDHLDLQIAQNIAHGMSPEEARLAALRSFDGVTRFKEQIRDTRRLNLLSDLARDVRYALRMLWRSPAFTAIAVVSLSLGIGANTAIFSVIDVMLFRKLAVHNPSELYALTNGSSTRFSIENFRQLREQVQPFAGVAAIRDLDRYNVAMKGESETIKTRIALVSGSYFPVLGVDATIGRLFTPADDRSPGGNPIAVVSDRYWNARFGHSPSILGQTFSLNGTVYTIVGATAAGFSGDWVGQPVDLWIPLAMRAQVMPEQQGDEKSGIVRLIARLQPDVYAVQASAAATVIFQQGLQQEAAEQGTTLSPRMAKLRIVLTPAARGYAPERGVLAQPLTILMIVVGMVLLIACANVANLLLARGALREREIAIRLGLGAGRPRIVRQLLTESVVLALAGGVFGLLFAQWGTHALLSMVAVGLQPVYLNLQPDARLLLFAFALSILTGFVFGIVPALKATSVKTSIARFRVGKTLVALQVALSLLLLTGSGLFLRTLHNLKSQDLGFERKHILLTWISPGQTGRKGPALASFLETAEERIASVNGIVAVTQSADLLNVGAYWVSDTGTLGVRGRDPKSGAKYTTSRVAPQFFETLGIRLLAGRDFNRGDSRKDAHVVVINRSLAEFFFGKRNPIGRLLGSPGCASGTAPCDEIIGVVSDIKQLSPRDQALGMIYMPVDLDSLAGDLCLAVRTDLPPERAIPVVRRQLHLLDPELPILKTFTIEQQLDEALAVERLIATLSGFFSTLAVLLASIGLYGVMSYTAARRTPEMGIRLALGASRPKVLLMVLKESLLLVVIGIAIGLPATLAATRLISNRLFGIAPADPLTIVTATILMTALAAVAGFLPAQKASRVDPMVALRHD